MATENKKIFSVSKNHLVDIQYEAKCIVFKKSSALRPQTTDSEPFPYVNAVSRIVPTTVKFDYPMSSEWNYFEIQILNEGALREMGIGVGPVDYTLYALPGWEIGSIGYHADNGGFYYSALNSGHVFGMKCHCSDTMGCGVDYSSQEYGHVTVWFTRNRKLAGPPEKIPLPKDGLYPLIGMSTLNESVLYTGHSCVPPPYSEVPAAPTG